MNPYRRLGKAGAAALVALLIVAATSLAYYLAYSGAGGGGSVTVGQTAVGGDSNAAQALTIAATVQTTGSGACNGALGLGCTDDVTFAVANADPQHQWKLVSLGTPTIATSVGGCLASWFTFTYGGTPDSSPNVEVASGTSDLAFGDSNSTLAFVYSSSVNQEACAGATVTLSFPNAVATQG
jgi:hypothetical protein